VILSIPDTNSRGIILASNHNLRRTHHTIRMIYGDVRPIDGEPLAELGVTSLATG
jgi:hypothetical protein